MLVLGHSVTGPTPCTASWPCCPSIALQPCKLSNCPRSCGTSVTPLKRFSLHPHQEHHCMLQPCPLGPAHPGALGLERYGAW